MNPTRSANSTETRRRSATGAGTKAGAPARAGSALCASDVPHSAQNFAAAGSCAPQDRHVRASAVPHSTQNFAPGMFSVAQLAQIIRCSAPSVP